MSNYRAIATVTATLAYMLGDVSEVVPNAGVTFLRPDNVEPDKLPAGAGVNIYLYNIQTNPSFRNMNEPTRWSNGASAQLPQVALNLDYLFSFYGKDSELEPQRLLGWTTSLLNAQAGLTALMIREAVNTYPFLFGSDLAEQIPHVKLTPLSLNVEELSKIWSVLLHAPYLLSALYQASVVLITPEMPPPPSALPVLERKLFVVPLRQPYIQAVSPREATPGVELVIKGGNFQADQVRVTFPTGTVALKPENGSQIKLLLPETLRAGVNSVVVTSELDVGTLERPESRSLLTSNVAAFVLQPLLKTVEYLPLPLPKLVITAEPMIYPEQSVSLWLTEANPQADTEPKVFGLTAKPHPLPTDSFEFASELETNGSGAALVPAGTYLARLSVDHSMSRDHKPVTIP